MSAEDRPQINLITPPTFRTDLFADQLARVLDEHEIACLRISLATKDSESLGIAADLCREIAHQRDVAVVIDSHLLLAQRHGLDGVHLADGARSVRAARKELGPDAIIGAGCGVTRHEGLNAAEAGADYVAFTPVGETGLGDGTSADFDLFEWWSEMIEVPVIAEGGLTAELIGRFGPVTDFFGIGEEIWQAENPSAALKTLLAPLG
ncbi:thiamine phosphate synthase [Pseudogemmobacter faecipullorum]|uniref:Thiamine phosphate synthase n=1 Tax=Pseudogemmobacter faecipullorum TaxID=2755041 RepID=A0ABS8CKY0_9RHOB|nr:thiamine phosphate synthase [Pseudogemmobacter faecipullorum]MCB5410049.1 thiamine phosphate synthase [Pseudogemmobacter faecipullorum]